ncbi:alpha/beta hydrolase [Pseudomonas sp. N040]|uniref:alpha/beta hydrolase n=1 Tax=Pseudomonas sp. N040 TaxID=2785325 RepID=UPI0018A24F7B|nr:alpha/beta fold hydrolase [Pseudomonas sp. N040]MBF7729927.1 alpha/beta fold hydrolase [Pseudomonas sp. N040]MBW7013569.1 lysophospholipase [Pseudomonas sp. N040]
MKLRLLLLCLPIVLIAAFLAGPRTSVDYRPYAGQLPSDLTAYLQQAEAAYPDITPGAEKTIRWASAEHRQTNLAIVYLHGFSATRQETAPLCDDLARSLGANLFYTRLSGHGRSNAALGEARAGQWLNDAEEALAIGKRLGRKVIIIGTSTGGTLATWLAATHNDPAILAYVLISPNFAPRDPAAQLLNWPWAKYFVPLLLGEERRWTPLNAEQARYWNHRYPSKVLLPMMALVQTVNAQPLEQVRTPLLLIHAADDQVVSATAASAAFARFGSAHKRRVELQHSQDPSHHVLAGRILAPADTARVAQLIKQFIVPLAGSAADAHGYGP